MRHRSLWFRIVLLASVPVMVEHAMACALFVVVHLALGLRVLSACASQWWFRIAIALSPAARNICSRDSFASRRVRLAEVIRSGIVFCHGGYCHRGFALVVAAVVSSYSDGVLLHRSGLVVVSSQRHRSESQWRFRVAGGRRRSPNLTFNTFGSPADSISCAAGEPEVLKVRLGVRFPLATTHPV